MLTEAMSGAVLGGLLRFAPEALKYLDRRNERRHELEMQELEFKFAKALGPRGSENIMPVFSEGTLDAMRESYIQDQAKVANKKYPFVAAMAALVRPSVTWGLLLLYVGMRVFQPERYNGADLELFSSVLSFWFLGRVWERQK